MDLSTPNYYQPPSFYASSQMESQERKTKGNPFAEALNNNNEDPICKLNLKETSDFVKSLPMSFNNGTQRRRENFGNRKLEAPLTPGRPIFSFSVSRKSVPSKWDDAEKWVFNGGGSCHESPAHHDFNTSNYYNHVIKQNEIIKSSNSKAIINEVIAEKIRVFEEGKISNGVIIPADLPLKDKFTDEIGPYVSKIRYSKPTKEAFLFKTQKHGNNEGMTDACTEIIPIHDTKHRDIGTEMTPLGSNTTSRCNTPFKSSSPARHNTPTSRSGPLALTDQSTCSIDMAQLQECNFSKLQIGSTQFDSVTTNWSSREEEEEEISKSLRHFEFGRRSSVSINETRACPNWEDEENAKFCLRYQREEAKIHAWVNLQTAKAEAQSRKLEVKIQKMRSNLEEKLMKKMAIVHRKAEEWRVAAQVEHCEQIKRASERTQKLIFNHQNTNISSHIISCGCFPCSSN